MLLFEFPSQGCILLLLLLLLLLVVVVVVVVVVLLIFFALLLSSSSLSLEHCHFTYHRIKCALSTTVFIFQGDEKVIDEAFKERDPQRHCAMRGMSGKVTPFS